MATKSDGGTATRPRVAHDVLAGTVPVATFAALGEVQDALAAIADGEFPIHRATVVGTDLRLVERVSGRMSVLRAAGYGTAAGAWLGALIAAFAAIFTAHSFGAVLSMLFGGIVLGALFGAVFGAVAYRFAGPRDGITGNVTLVAERYELRAAAGQAASLREALTMAAPAGMALVEDPSATAAATADDLLQR
jgi:hypothetical protein